VHSTREEIERLSINYETVRLRPHSLRGFDILFVEPGSETGFLAALGRLDLLNGLVEWIRCTYGYEVILGTHHTGTTIRMLEESQIGFRGYVTPINQLGVIAVSSCMNLEQWSTTCWIFIPEHIPEQIPERDFTSS